MYTLRLQGRREMGEALNIHVRQRKKPIPTLTLPLKGRESNICLPLKGVTQYLPPLEGEGNEHSVRYA
jgi:hypothetical protein